VLVRAGLVKPVSLVRSAVEATLMLLVMDRRRGRAPEMAGCAWWASSSCPPTMAFVSEDCSLGRRMGAREKLEVFLVWDRMLGISGGSSSSPRSSLLSDAQAGALNVTVALASIMLIGRYGQSI
jgi:hypothetical protein